MPLYVRRIAWWAVVAVLAVSCHRPAPPVASPAHPPVLVVVSLDGFRADYLDRPAAVHLRALAARGVRASRLIPSFPSKTFPNHYSLVTGLYPEHHGIVANVMLDSVLGRFATGNDPSGRDGRWWLGEPIWVTAERQGQRSAIMFWPGNEAAIQGVRPHWWRRYDGRVTNTERVDQVLQWLAMPVDSSPRFIGVYFSDTDDAGHRVGPFGAATDSAIARVDSAVGALMRGIEALNASDFVNLMVVSDHGMANVSRDRLIPLYDYVAPESVTVVDLEPVTTLIPRAGADAYVYAALHDRVPHLTVWRKDSIPERLHYRASARIAPVVALADEGWTVVTQRADNRWQPGETRGAHGYDNELPSMGALFVASGPAFRQGLRVGPFANIHVYSLMTHILGLRAAPNDGSLSAVQDMLRAR